MESVEEVMEHADDQPQAARFAFAEPTSELGRALVELLGQEKVCDADDVRETHASDKWYAKARPEVVVFAESTEAQLVLMLIYLAMYNWLYRRLVRFNSPALMRFR